MESPEKVRLEAFFRHITRLYTPPRPVTSLIITHILRERPAFLDAMARTTELAAVLPKPKSVDAGTLAQVRRTYTVHDLSRELFADPSRALHFLEDTVPERELILLDIGGYFAPCLGTLAEKYSGTLLGIIEDTENGHQRYAALDHLPCPVISVARSPLKDCEDHLVGRSIVFSTEALMRARGDIFTGREASVIGFGKIGRAISHTLRAHDLQVTVYDTDPVKRVQAHSQGFRITPSRTEALQGAGVILCATGNLALRQRDFETIPNGAYIASVTSSEDELELRALDGLYRRTNIGAELTRYDVTGHYFYVLADGGAVNFVHGAAVGAYIHLVQAEIIAATASLSSPESPAGLHELPASARQDIATAWLDHFVR